MILASDSDETQKTLSEAGASEEVACKLTEDGIGERLEYFLRTSSDDKVQTAAVWAVVNLSYDIDVAALLGSSGCCTAVVGVASKWTESDALKDIDTAVCWAIRNLSCPSLNLGIFSTTNVCEVVKNMITRGMREEDYDLVQSA
eukprot:gene25842-32339_t